MTEAFRVVGVWLSRVAARTFGTAHSFVSRQPALALGLVVFALALACRLPDMGASCNVDAVLYWFGRTRKFWDAVSDGRYSETYYSPHPGVSIMWLSGASLQAGGRLNAAVTERSVVLATAPLAVLASLVPGLSVPVLYRMLSASPPDAGKDASTRFGPALPRASALLLAGLTGALLATEPFHVAHARTFQLDATATGFVWLGTLLGALALFERRTHFALAGGACFGIAVLTRMLSATFLVGLAVAYALAFLVERPRPLRLVFLCFVLGASALATTVLLWPALLTNPVETLSRVLRDTGNTVGRGHVEFSWGEVYRRDPGPKFYGGVMLMRLSPEVLGLTLIGLAFAWRWPRRALVVLGVLGCAYLPPAVGLLTSAKKADRYALLFFPIITFIACCAALDLARRIFASRRIGARAGAVIGLFVALLLGLRAIRIAAVHPVPIAWCASYPGLRCEDVITLGQGEGFRDAALWIEANSPVKNPSILSAYAGGAVLGPWLDFRRVREVKKADFVLTYIASDQRGNDTRTREEGLGKPLHEVRFEGRTYVRIFMGGKHPDARRRKRNR